MIADAFQVRGHKMFAQDRLLECISVETICATLNAAMLVSDVDDLLNAC